MARYATHSQVSQPPLVGNRNAQGVLRYYWLSGSLESLAALVLLLLIPSDPKNAWLLGLSKSRLTMGALLIASALVFAWLYRRGQRQPGSSNRLISWLTPYLEEARWSVPVLLGAYGLVVYAAYFYLLIVHANLSTLQGVLIRLSPFFLLGLTRLSQTILVYLRLGAIQQGARPGRVGLSLESLSIRPRKTALILVGIALLLVLTSASLDVIEQLTWAQKFFGYRVKFDLDQEANVPTFFSTFLLVFMSFLLGVVAATKEHARDRFARHWAFLAGVFLLLAVDETAVLHEKLIPILQSRLHTHGIFYFAWVIPAIPLVIFFLIIIRKFFLHLPGRTKWGFGIGFGLYITGVLGFEILGSWFADTYGENLGFYNVITTLEETIEMAGVIVLILTALQYLGAYAPEVQFRFAPKKPEN